MKNNLDSQTPLALENVAIVVEKLRQQLFETNNNLAHQQAFFVCATEDLNVFKQD